MPAYPAKISIYCRYLETGSPIFKINSYRESEFKINLSRDLYSRVLALKFSKSNSVCSVRYGCIVHLPIAMQPASSAIEVYLPI